MSNTITFKLQYTCEEDFTRLLMDYSNVVRYTYNRLWDANLKGIELKTKPLTALQKQMENKPDSINSHLMNSAIYDSKELLEQSPDMPVIFGGKQNFLDRCKKKITKEEYKLNRLRPLYSIGQANNKGNRLFTILDVNTILFKLDKHHHYELKLQKLNRKRTKELEKLIQLQNECKLPITYRLDLEYVYITFDYSYITTYQYKTIQNRVMAIDINPNYIGYSIVDWKSENKYHIVSCGSFSLKTLNDYQKKLKVSSNSKEQKYITNKRNEEVILIAKELFELCRHFKCEVFSMEDLSISSQDNGRGNRYNRLVNNQWNRNLLVNQIKKHIQCSSTLLQEILPQYSSFVGNIVYRNTRLPDYVLASIEIGRRGYEYSNQYIFKRHLIKKNIIFPDLQAVKNQIIVSLAEINVGVPAQFDWTNIYSEVKKSGVEYRFSLEDTLKVYTSNLFSKFYKQSYLQVYTFI